MSTTNNRKDRIAYLQTRVEARQMREAYDAAIDEARRFLSTTNFIEFEGFLSQSEAGVQPLLLWQEINKLDAQPSMTIGIEAPESDLKAWLMLGLTRIGISDKYLISFGDNSDIPWAKVRMADDREWLFSLWNLLDDKELIVINAEQTHMFGIIEEEYGYVGFLKSLPI